MVKNKDTNIGAEPRGWDWRSESQKGIHESGHEEQAGT